MIRVDDKAERSQRGNPSTSRSTARSDWHGRTKVDVSKGAATFARVSDDGRGEVYVPDAFIRGTSSERAAISERLLSGNASGLGSFAQRGFVRFGFTLDSTTRVRQPYIESPWIRAALKAISGGFVQLKPRIYDRDPADADAVEIQVPELTRLLRRPNRVQTQRQLQKALAIEAKLTGDVFWFLLNASGEPIKVDEEGFWKEWPAGIMPAASRYVEHKLDRETGMPAAYRYRVASSAGASGSHSEAFPPGAVVHFIDYDPDTLVRGRGDVESIMRDVDLYFQVSRYLDASVRSGGQPGGVVTYKERLSPYEIDARQQSLEDELANGHQGAWRILDADARFTPNPVTPKDMEYGGLLEWLRDVKLSGLGVPPPVLGIYADATLNNVETAYRELWRGPNGVLTLAVDTADVITQSFLYRASKLNRALEDAVFVWDSSDVEDLRTEQVDQVVKAAEVVSKGIGVSLNGTLAGMGVDTQVDGGDMIVSPQAPPQVGQQPANQNAARAHTRTDEVDIPFVAPKERQKGGDATLRANVLGWLNGYTRAIRAHIRKVANAAPGELNADAPETRGIDDTFFSEDLTEAEWRELLLDDVVWIEAMTEATGAPLESIYAKALETARASVPGAPILTTSSPRVFRALTAQRIQLAEGATSSAARAVRRAILEALAEPGGDPADGLSIRQRIKAVLPALDEKLERIFGTREARAATIAQTETGKGEMTAKMEQWSAGGVTELEWFTSGDDAVRSSHQALNSERVPFGATFSNGLRYPLDPNGTAAEVINCRCDAVPTKRLPPPDEGAES